MASVQVGPGKTATLTCEMTGVDNDAALTVTWLKGANDPVTTSDAPGLTMSTSGKRYGVTMLGLRVSYLWQSLQKYLTTKSISDFSITLKSNVSDTVTGGEQTATLAVESGEITTDRSFTCQVQSSDEATGSTVDATVNKYGMLV